MGLRRRELLKSSLGAGVLLGGCRDQALPLPSITPEFVGQTPERGHLLRSGDLLSSRADTRERVGVAIVGGGAAGWSAAWRLRRAGLDDLALFELEDEIGGTARSGSLPRSAHPMGAHYLPTPPRECSELLDLLADLRVLVGHEHDGTPEYATTAICAAPEERHFHEHSWHPGLYPRAGETADEADQWARFWDRLRALDRARDAAGELVFRLPVRRSAERLRHLDRMSMAAWLDEHGFDSWRLRWYVDYACRDDYGCTVDQTSAFAGLHHFLARGLEDTRDGDLLTWAGGNGELLDAIRDHVELGPRLRRAHVVYAIDPDAGVLWVRDLATARTLEVRAEAILWAAPRFLLPHVLHANADPLQAPLAAGALTYAPWLVANLELREAPGGLGAALAWDNVPIIQDPRARNLGYVLATHQEGRERSIEPGAVITYYEPLVAPDPTGLAARRAQLLASTADALAEQVLRALEHMHPAIRRHVQALHLHRWGHAMIRPVPGLLFGDALARARQPIGRVRACGTDVGGLPLFEEAFYMAVEAADWALERIGRG